MLKDSETKLAKIKNESSKHDEYQQLEKTLWKAADKLRSNMDAAEYKHVVLGLIFLKYVSDSFTRIYEKLKKEEFADPEDSDEYRAENVFWVPPNARWINLQNRAKEHEVIGQLVDQSMADIEKDNPKLRGVLPRNYARPELNKQKLGELIDLISGIGFGESREEGLDLLGRVYEYFIGEFADAEGKKGGQFYTPRCIVKLLVEMIEPYEGRVYDPCCGSGGMFIQSKAFVKKHQGRLDRISIYGQESNPTTWKLCLMNLAIRGIEGDIKWGDSFTYDQHIDLKAEYILANPPFNMSDWSRNLLLNDVRWTYGLPPANNANFAWVQHFIHHLSPNGIAGFVLANGSLSSNVSTEGEIRKLILENDLVECIIKLPDKLFYNTQISACLWFVNRNKKRKHETLFIDATSYGSMTSKKHRVLNEEEINLIVDTFKNWKYYEDDYEDIKGFCKSSCIEEIIGHKNILVPGRYAGPKKIHIDKINKDEYDHVMQISNERFQKIGNYENKIKGLLGDI